MNLDQRIRKKATDNLNLNCFDFETKDWNKNQQSMKEKNSLNQTNAKYQFKNMHTCVVHSDLVLIRNFPKKR